MTSAGTRGLAVGSPPPNARRCRCAPRAKHCPDYRVNFLHYYYVLYKLFELLDENYYLQEIPMLKDREKLIEQDAIWKKICIELNWEFNSTM